MNTIHNGQGHGSAMSLALEAYVYIHFLGYLNKDPNWTKTLFSVIIWLPKRSLYVTEIK